MPFNLKVGGAWKQGTGAQVKVGGAWKTVESIQVKVGGAWKVAFTNSISPGITATVSPNPSAFSQDVTISGFVLPVPTGGMVLVRDSNNNPVGAEANVNTSTGAYSITIPDQGVGTYTFSVNYSGFDLYQPASTNATVNVGTIPTTTTITRSAATYQYNQTRITLSGTVSPTPLTGGTVTISNTSEGTIGVADVSVVNGSYSLLVPVKDVGSYTNIVASYGGSGNYASSVSGTTSYSVTQASTSLVPAMSNTTPQAGSTTTLSATLTTGSPGTALSGRSVTFQGLNSGVWNNLGTGTTNVSGVASFVWTAVVGYTAIRAVYAGETNYASVTSSGISITVVTTISTTTSIARSAAAYTYNSTRVTISGTVSPTPTGGTVAIKNGTTTLATATVNTSTGAYSALMPVQDTSTYTVTAEYSGFGGLYLASTSSATLYTVNAASTAITSTPSFDVNNGTVVTLTTRLTTGGAGFNNQTITFQVLRSSDSVWVNAGTGTTNSNGDASLDWTTGNAYSQSRAVYSATTNYSGSTSAGVAFTTRGAVTDTIDAAAGSSNWYFRGSIASAQQVGMNFTSPAAVSGANQYSIYRVDIAVSGINGSEGQVRACLWNQGGGGALLTAGATVNLPSRADGSTTRTAFTGTNFPAVTYTPGTGYKIGFWRRGNSTTYQTQWRQNTGTGRNTYWDNSESSPGGFDQDSTFSGHSLDVIIYFQYYVKNN
jgi:hypothetical protein